MFDGPNMTRSQGLEPELNSRSVLATKASAGITSVSIFTPSLSYRSFSTRVSEYFTYSAFTTARMVWPSYGRAAPTGGTREPSAMTSPISAMTIMIMSAARRMTTSLDDALALGSPEGQAFHEIALQHEGDGERG